MGSQDVSLLDRAILDVPLAVVDLETTGFAGADEIVELCVFRVEPGSQQPRRVLDTLVRPDGDVGPTRVHGIRAEEVADAPRFGDIAARVAMALNGAVLVAHNVPFDLRMLQAAFRRCDIEYAPPTLCTSAVTRALGYVLPDYQLATVCRQFAVPYVSAHTARADALAASWVALFLRRHLRMQGCVTFRQALGRCAAGLSVDRPLPVSWTGLRPSACPLAPRLGKTQQGDAMPAREAARQTYAAALLAAVDDYQIEEHERLYLFHLQSGLLPAEIAAAHAQVMATALSACAADAVLDDGELQRLALLQDCLASLGWAPGLRNVVTQVEYRG